MSKKKPLTPEEIEAMESLAQASHRWAATGVSGYPLTHPVIGQGRLGQTFRHFIHLMEDDREGFAQVFAIVAQWGIGKSRLGYEIISQINGTSPGWQARDESGELTDIKLFDSKEDRNRYLGLYIRYSQVANDYHNVDNWFGYGLYKALKPLAGGVFDRSIQGAIAKEAYDRLMVLNFDSQKLAEALELARNHSDEDLYEDPHLVSRLCQAAYDYLRTFGIEYVVVVLDELETVAEAATYGLEADDIKRLDGRAIKLMGQAIKEEDPRRKLPWLRYVALCSSAIGDELREVQSTARRFEIIDLAQNAFSDRLTGKVSFIFQPCEETRNDEGKSGAQFMLTEELIGDVDHYFAGTVESTFQNGKVFVRDNAVTSAIDRFDIDVFGKAGHGAYG